MKKMKKTVCFQLYMQNREDSEREEYECDDNVIEHIREQSARDYKNLSEILSQKELERRWRMTTADELVERTSWKV